MKKLMRKYKRAANLIEQCKNYVFWNFFIRWLLQSYLDYCISVALVYVIKEGVTRMWVWYTLAVLLTILVALLPVALFRSLNILKEDKLLEDLTMIQKYGTLWANYRIDQLASLHYYSVFLLRRLIFAFVSVHLGLRNGGLTLIVACYISILYQVLYLVEFHPNKDAKDQKLEVFSEFMLLYFFYGILVD